ncbi:uncharacterized protein LOC122513160 [Polistes fuscatus]|uniref:uncharacterized protein LOC122513160 n=1 Tax=Polistes fuscatus TaxID=30207 RepID=UPI001CAA2242|nr:uncharacterized protein LOC122513160 [Polistes fuscatus]
MDLNSNCLEIGNWLFNRFNPYSMVFLRWLNSLEYILEISNTTNDNDKVKVLLNMLEPCVLKKIQKKLFPSNPFDVPYDEILTLLENTYSPFCKGNSVKYRYKYRHQLPEESIEHYFLALRKLLSKCSSDFQNTANLKKQFIKGILHKKTKILLQSDENMSQYLTIYMAKQMELANNDNNNTSEY